jgi:tRNA modification GTPase
VTSPSATSAAPNLAALLTPPGSGAIAVIRITGQNVTPFLARHFSGRVAPSRCAYGELRDGGGAVLDDAVVVLLPHGLSADLNLHGGPGVIESVRQLLAKSGFTLIDALPLAAVDGEDLIEREMLAWLPFAKTEPAIRMLLSQPQAWRTFVASNPNRDELARVAADQCLWRMLNPARVAIVGLPNVGKSTLANHLFGQERSITADLPGTTRDWIGELADIDGVPILLLDTPGLRDSSDVIEQSAIALSRAVIAGADLVIVVFDPTQPAAPQIALAESHVRRLAVLNKSDLGAWPQSVDATTVATTGAGVDSLRTLIRQQLGCANVQTIRPCCWTQRQRQLIEPAPTGTTDIAAMLG